MSIFQKNAALAAIWKQHKKSLCAAENLPAESIEAAIEAGTMVLLGNPAHPSLLPLLVGQPSRVKINANIGTSPLCHCPETEQRKLQMALDAGADTVMDLSIAGDLNAIRAGMLATCRLPIGTVPMYAVAQKILDADLAVSTMKADDLFTEIAHQGTQGVDFITVHCGLTRRGAEWATQKAGATQNGRIMGIVSRGGSILARWMLDHQQENPLLDGFDHLLDIALKHNMTLSLGDGLRPGAGVDAGDAAQWEEVITLGRLAEYALSKGVQCMIEGPGHVPLHEVENQIQGIKKLTHNAPLYVLGPLTVDSAPGYDHIAGAIGGAIAVKAGVDFLCYLTPAEHLTLPDVEDVRAGVMASRVAAHAGEVALGRPHALAREHKMNAGRAALNWDMMTEAALDPAMLMKRREEHKHEDVCAMCGKFCAVKMLKDREQK
ncbi:MAG: phosphomethylpyrimidine synthase ThiC [Desulfovibrionaceae bacterium]